MYAFCESWYAPCRVGKNGWLEREFMRHTSFVALASASVEALESCFMANISQVPSFFPTQTYIGKRIALV